MSPKSDTLGQSGFKPALRPRLTSYLKDFIFCVSFSHLFFLRYWDEVQDHTFSYYLKSAAGNLPYTAAVLDTILLALIFWVILQLVRRSEQPYIHRAAEVMFVFLLVLMPLNTVRKDLLHVSFFDLTANWSLAARSISVVLLACVGAWVLRRYFSFLFGAARTLVWLLVCLLPLTLLQTARLSMSEKPAAFLDQPLASALANQVDRVVMVIFDELDLGFVTVRPREIEMPEWDRLSSQSLLAERTSSPAPDTLEAIPSIVTGKRVETAKPESVDTLRVRYDSGDYADWKQQPSLFSLAREAGLNVGVSGWYHPYCRLFGSSTVSCFWTPASGVLHRKELMDNLDVPAAMALQYRRMLLEIPGLPYIAFLKPSVGLQNPAVRELERVSTHREYSDIHENALRLVADPKLNVVYLHYPVPHMLTIYDRDTKTFSIDDGNNYFDNLLLVDRTIGEIRSALEHAGLWNRTALLITSDHPLRLDIYRASPEWNAEQENAVSHAPERYIPYMLKLPGQAQGGRYSKAFNSVVTKDLLLALLSRKIVSPQDVIAWLDKSKTSGEHPSITAALPSQ